MASRQVLHQRSRSAGALVRRESDERRVTDAKPRTPEEEDRAFRIAIFKVLERIATALERSHPAPRELSVDLDGKYGDTKLKFKPRDWTGDFTKGQSCSSSPPELLDLYAQALEHFASKADDIPDVDESAINPRKHFNGIDELAKNVAVHGILQRLLVRPVPGHDDAAPYQIVFGARRYRAAVKAGLKKIPVTIRELDDAHAFELMVVENCQREDVHPLEEAEGYERMNRDFGYSVDDIAGKVHKSRSAIYARMKLCALCPEAHKAFFADKFTAETALAIARIPSPVLQKDAIKQLESAGWEGERVSTRRAFQIIQGRYMLRLDAAPFKTTDETLVPAAGSCAKCPKRTGNQPELFADVKSKDTCSDPDCYKSKVVATTAQKVKELESKGGTVLTEKETKKLFPYGEGSMSVAEGASYFPLDNSCHEDPKGRSYRALLKGKAVKLVGAVHSTKGLVELVSRAEAAKLLKGLDLRSHAAQAGSFGAAEKKRRDAGILRNAVSMLALAEIVSAAEKKKPDPKFWNAITPLLIKSLPHECAKAIVKRRELGVVHDSFAFEKESCTT